MNSVTLRGKVWNLRHLTQAPNTGKEMDLVCFDLASYSGGDGLKIDKYTRIQCECWYKKQAHVVKEGDNVRVFGKLLSRNYEKDGKKHHKYFLNVQIVEILERREAVDDEQPMVEEATDSPNFQSQEAQ